MVTTAAVAVVVDTRRLGSELAEEMAPLPREGGDERRVDADGRAYTRRESIAFYGNDAVWKASPRVGDDDAGSRKVPNTSRPRAVVPAADWVLWDDAAVLEALVDDDLSLSTAASPLSEGDSDFFFTVSDPQGTPGRRGRWSITTPTVPTTTPRLPTSPTSSAFDLAQKRTPLTRRRSRGRPPTPDASSSPTTPRRTSSSSRGFRRRGRSRAASCTPAGVGCLAWWSSVVGSILGLPAVPPPVRE